LLTEAVWHGGTHNPYPGGDSCLKYKPGISNGVWFCYAAEGYDVFVQTYLTPPIPTPPVPTTKDSARTVGGALLKNQGDCVSFTATGANNGPANARMP
jgi:hypothetical protein